MSESKEQQELGKTLFRYFIRSLIAYQFSELLERVFLRLGLAESDEQLQQIVARFICPVINKGTSEHQSVRDKVGQLSYAE